MIVLVSVLLLIWWGIGMGATIVLIVQTCKLGYFYPLELFKSPRKIIVIILGGPISWGAIIFSLIMVLLTVFVTLLGHVIDAIIKWAEKK